jgi:hypothetical protein
VEEIREQDLYRPFAQYLTGELEECSKAVPLGGKIFDDKWELQMFLGYIDSPIMNP